MRTGLILAAGYGSRQAVGSDLVLKPLVPVAGRALILRALDGLAQAGCARTVVVVGYEADKIRAFITESYAGGMTVEFVTNDRFDLHNGVSVLAARDALQGEFVLAMADHVFEPAVMDLVARQPCPENGATLIVDFKLETIVDMDDATKVDVRDGRVDRIGKNLTTFNAVDCGVFVAGPALLDALDEVFARTGNASLSDGVQKLAAAGMMEAADLGKALWQDVDTPEMLAAAERLLKGLADSRERGAAIRVSNEEIPG